MIGLTDAETLKQKYVQFLSCIATSASPRTKLAETKLWCLWPQIAKPG